MEIIEEWRPVIGHEGHYVSNFGNVKRKDVLIECSNGVRRLIKARYLSQVKDTHGYYCVTLSGNIRRLVHRLMGESFLSVSKDKDIDHIDGIRTNNSLSNLRVCSRSQNNANSKRRTNNSSGLKGVCWDQTRLKWRANIKFCDKQIHLGRFPSKEQAAEAYDNAAVKYYGEFSRTNAVISKASACS